MFGEEVQSLPQTRQLSFSSSYPTALNGLTHNFRRSGPPPSVLPPIHRQPCRPLHTSVDIKNVLDFYKQWKEIG